MGKKIGYLRTFALLATLPLLLFSVFYPIAAASPDAPSSSEPEACAPTPDRTVSNESDATVIATASQESNGTINISYDYKTDDRELSVDPPSKTEVVDSEGFDSTRIGGTTLHANHSADTQWIRYRTGEINIPVAENATRYPSSDGWLIGKIPQHAAQDVYLEPADSGYIGSNSLYLGDYTKLSRTVGCQELEIIVPADIESDVDGDARLDDLEAAAQTIPSEKKYETVRVFISPTELHPQGLLSGFVYNFENDIVVQNENDSTMASFIWMHEYIHTIQKERVHRDHTWTIEASATQLAIKAGVESGRLTPIERDMFMAQFAQQDWNTSLASDSRGRIAYMKGALVLAQMDEDLQNKSNKSSYDILQWVNQHPYAGADEFNEYLEAEAGLENSTVASYNEMITEQKPASVRYTHAPSWMPVWGFGTAQGLLHPSIRVISALVLMVHTVQILWGGLTRFVDPRVINPDELDF